MNMNRFAVNMLIDTHAHLYDSVFKDDWSNVLERIHKADVRSIFLPNVDTSTISSLNELTKSNPELFYPLMGLHPCSVNSNYETDLEMIYAEFSKSTYYGVGEVGIDLYWDKTYYKEQTIAFKEQVKWSNEFKLPVIIHSREATMELISILSHDIKAHYGGIFHCFTGTEEEAKRIIDLGFYIGIGGVVTFKNSNLSDVIKKIGIQHLVLETDSPYLAPVPYRGKRNESSYTKIVAEKLADVLQIDYAEVCRITSMNALSVFQLNKL